MFSTPASICLIGPSDVCGLLPDASAMVLTPSAATIMAMTLDMALLVRVGGLGLGTCPPGSAEDSRVKRSSSLGGRSRSIYLAGLDERQEVLVELGRVRLREAVRAAAVDLERRVLHEPGCAHRRRLDGNDLIVVAVRDERGYLDLREVGSELGLGELLDAVVDGLHARLHAV